MKARIIQKEQFATIHWPEDEFHTHLRSYITPLIYEEVSQTISNVTTSVALIEVDSIFLPITVNESEFENSNVCSVYGHYIDYGKYELGTLNTILRIILKPILTALGLVLRLGKINKVVSVNNWLFTTNLYPILSKIQIQEITECLKENYPQHAILFRSLNSLTTNDIMSSAVDSGYKLIAARQVYILNNTKLDFLKKSTRRKLKKDKLLLSEHQYHIEHCEKLTFTELARIRSLYNLLYLGKYSEINPKFTDAFFKSTFDSQFIRYFIVKKSGAILAVLGCFSFNKVMTTPVFGYDTSLHKDAGLYRILNYATMQIAELHGYVDHASSGAAEFKRNRGYKPVIEYNAVHYSHLSCMRRCVWALLAFFANIIGVPIIQKFEL